MPLFAGLIDTMASQRQVVMDLGPARSRTVALLSEFRCRLDIIDLPAALDRLNGRTQADIPDLELEIQALFPPAGSDSLTAVLCWDLLNYLDKPALQALMAALAIRSQHGTRLHALIGYSSPTIPAVPGIHYPAGSDSLVSVPATDAQIPSPRYTPKKLEKYMRGFSAQRTMLLNNGMQEFLFRM